MALATLAAVAVGIVAHVGSAAAAPGDLTFQGCVGDLTGCTTTKPAMALDFAIGVAVSPDGKQLYAVASHGNAVSHFTLDSSGNPTFKGCVGDLTGCTTTNPAGALDSADGVAVSPDGKQLYAASANNNVSHFTLDSSGDPSFQGCVGDLTGCTTTNPATALDVAQGLAVSPDGKQLYAVAGNAVSHLTLDSSGDPSFQGCVGELTGCTATDPGFALGGAQGVAVSPDGKQLYVAAFDAKAVSHLTLDSSGNPTFQGCVGRLFGCTSTTPDMALQGAYALAVSPDTKQLYAVSINGNNVSHFALDSSGNPSFRGCVGDLTGCTATDPATALDGADGVAVTPDGKHLYAASRVGNAVSHLTLDSSGNPSFQGCVGDLTGCDATNPAAALDGAQGVAVGPDGTQLYAASLLGSAVSHFTIAQPTLTVSLAGTGSGTVTGPGFSCPGSCFHGYPSGTMVTLTATPAPGSTFAGWSGACSGTGTCTVTMSSDRSVTATFSTGPPPPTHKLTVLLAGSGSGTVTSSPPGISCPSTCSHSYTNGTKVTVTATAASGSVFSGWSGASCSGTGTCTVTMSSNQSVTAAFTASTPSPPPPPPNTGCQDPAGAYNQGFNTGFNSGYNAGFNSGFSAGFQSGFSEGFGSATAHTSLRSSSSASGRAQAIAAQATYPACNPQFNQGFNTGFNPGFNSGFQTGFPSGFDSGFKSGFNDGFKARHHRHHR